MSHHQSLPASVTFLVANIIWQKNQSNQLQLPGWAEIYIDRLGSRSYLFVK